MVRGPAAVAEVIPSVAQDVVDTVREPLLILDGALRVRSANRAFYRAFRVRPAETEGCLIYELGDGQWDIPALRTLLEDVIPGRSAFDDFELEHDFPGVGRKVMLLNARVLRPGDHATYLVLAMEDVTERRRVRDVERRYTAELQEKYRRLQELETLRDDLTHMIIHDLRTPLTSVIAGVQTLEAVGDLNEAQCEVMALALAGGETLLGMINDLLDVEKFGSGALTLERAPVDPEALAAAAAAQVASLAESKDLALAVRAEPGLPALHGDENKLRRTLVNLLGNAIKFTPPGGTVTLVAERADGGRSVAFSVTDTGEGIPREAFGRIFEKFGQVESRRLGRTTGTGLGLTFCRMAVEAHGGAIGVESAPGRGSTFRFTIPVPAGGGH